MASGATVTDADIADDATTESTTGGASRQAIAEMRDGERHIRYHTTLPEAVDIPDDQTDDIHVLLDSDGNAISLYHFSIVEETEEWLLTVGVGLGVRGYAAGISSGYGHISPNGPNVGFTALNRSTNGRFILTYDGATGLVRADSRTLYIRQRGTSGNWHVVQMDEIATPYEYVSTTNGHNFTFREGTAYNVIVRRAADTNDGGNIAAVLTSDRDIAFEDGASLVQLADVQDLLHIGEVVEVVYQQVAGLAAAEVAVDASGFTTGNLSATDIDAQTAFETINALTLGGGGGTVNFTDVEGTVAVAQFADDTISIDRLLGDVANFGGDVIRATTTGGFEVGPVFFGELSGGTNFINSLADGTTITASNGVLSAVGGGGGTATSAIVYKAHLEDTTFTDAESADWHEVLEINTGTDDIEFNDGPFTHTTHTDGHELVCIPVGQDGYYEIESDIVLRQSGSAVNRVTYVVRYTIRAEGTTTDTGQSEKGFEYNRGIDANNSISSFELAVIYDLNGGDCIGVQVKTYDADEGDTNAVEFGYTVIGDDSFIEIVKHGGIAGAVGATGPAGVDGGTDDQTAAEVTVDATGFVNGNLATTDDTAQKVAQKVHDLNVGGTGDITAVTTASNSGLAGGSNSGNVALVVNLPGLPNSSSIVSTGTLAGATGGGSSVEYSVGAVSTYVQGQAVTDTSLNATSALEAQTVAPSRQVVAELRDSLTSEATETQFGLVRLATEDEVEDENSGAFVITPELLAFGIDFQLSVDYVSYDSPEPVVQVGDEFEGSGPAFSFADHEHALPVDSTLEFNAAGNLGVTRPLGTWYGAGQTEPHAVPSARPFLAERYYRLTYESAAPNRHWDGGDSMGVSVLDSAGDSNYDLITRDSAGEALGDKRVIQFEAGRYRFKTRIWSSAADPLEMGLFVYRSVAGDDQMAWFASGGYNDPVNDPLGTGEMDNVRIVEFNEIIEHAVTTHYTQILVIEDFDSQTITPDQDVSFYTEIERLD